MTGRRQQHKGGPDGAALAVCLAVLGVLLLVAHRVLGVAIHVVWDVARDLVLTLAFLYGHRGWLFLALALAVAARLGLGMLRFIRATPAARRNYPSALWARARWRWLTRNLGLGYEDRHRRARLLRSPFGTSVTINDTGQIREVRIRYPRARFRVDGNGFVAHVRTVPKSGRRQFEDQAEHIANAWRCTRVQVSQPKPGRLIVRGLRTDPLAVPLPMDQAPSGTYTAPHAYRPYLGLDEWGHHRYADLSGVTGITIAGLPGYGKTSLVLSLLHQLAGTPAAQFAFIDGKGGGDFHDWHDRAWLFCDDDLADAAAVLEDVHAEMRRRLGRVTEATGHRNAWHRGPAEDFPLLVTVIDECHTFFDLDGVKGDREAEKRVRTCRTLTGQLVKKGRSVMMLTILITQKQTGDAVPTAIRDNCSIGFSFAVKTRDAAVAGLGEAIRDYPSFCPTGLLERPTYIGVATASLPTGADPFVRLRVPEITEQAAADRARATAHLRRDPAAVLPQPVTIPRQRHLHAVSDGQPATAPPSTPLPPTR